MTCVPADAVPPSCVPADAVPPFFLFGATASAGTASAGTIWGRTEEFFFHLTASQTSKVLLVNEVKFEDSDYH